MALMGLPFFVIPAGIAAWLVLMLFEWDSGGLKKFHWLYKLNSFAATMAMRLMIGILASVGLIISGACFAMLKAVRYLCRNNQTASLKDASRSG